MQVLRDVSIENFRSCKSCDLPLAEYIPMVGYNNGGKSNILAALQWLLDGSGLGETDFFDPDETVTVTGAIDGIDPPLLGKLVEKHRDRISPFCVDGTLKIRRVQSVPSGYKKDVDLEIWDPEEEEWKTNPTGIPAAISALFPSPILIGAMEDSTEDVGKYKSTTTIGKLLGQVTGPLEEKHGATIESALADIRRVLEAEGEERAPELKEFDEGANALVEEFFPGVRVALHLPPPEIKELFKSGTIKVYEDESEEARDIESLGHGAQRSIQMALVRYLADVQADQDSAGARTLLLIDEPELYLHPQAVATVRSALRDLASGNYQVIFSTHSPQMVGIDDAPDTVIIRKSKDEGTHALPTIREAIEETIDDAQSQANTLFEFGNAAKILFTDRVIVAEGKAEGRLLPSVIERIRGRDLGRSKTALVYMGGANNIAKALMVLESMGIPAKAVVDLDYAFKAAVSAGFVSRSDEEHARCREILDLLCEDHPITLGGDDLPKNGSELSAEEAFALLAEKEEAQGYITSLHDRLRAERIWLWKKGALEDHLGLSGKSEETWGQFIESLATEGAEAVITDYEGVCSFLDWALE